MTNETIMKESTAVSQNEGRQWTAQGIDHVELPARELMTENLVPPEPVEDGPVVFVVDDDPAARDSVAALLCSKGATFETFASAEEFLGHFDRSLWGCLVADVRMMGMTGLELQQRLLDEQVDLPVILITGFGDISSAITAMRAGAVTFLQKPCPDHELWENIAAAIERHRRCREDASEHIGLRTRLAGLLPAERDVLQRVVIGMANKVIANELDIGLRTVELRRASVLKKMEAHSVADLVRMVIEAEGAIESCG